MDLPRLPDEQEALANWTAMIRKLKGFLEANLERAIDEEEVNRQIGETNPHRSLPGNAAGTPGGVSNSSWAWPASGQRIAPGRHFLSP